MAGAVICSSHSAFALLVQSQTLLGSAGGLADRGTERRGGKDDVLLRDVSAQRPAVGGTGGRSCHIVGSQGLQVDAQLTTQAL